ncbi:recombinase family protein [Geodermatophilus sp. URMC 65]
MATDASPAQPNPIRAVAYVRVSQARDGTISPELQLRAIEEHCRQRGYLVTETLQDLDLSGRFWPHRQMERAITMIEHGQADAIVVWRWSRVSRNRLDWALAVDRVEAAGGALESATEGFDTTTSTGRLARGVLAELAAFESDRVGDVWREIRERRVALGLPGNGQAMFGYRKRNGQYVPDRRTGPILAELYRRAIRGTSFAALARWLNSHRIPTAASSGTHGAWTGHGLARLLDLGFAAGYVTHGGKLVPGAQQPLITAEVWSAYRARRDASRYHPRQSSDDFLVAGLVWCACGNRMAAVHAGAPSYCRYQCRKHPPRRPGQSIIRARLDDMVHSWLTALVDDPALRDDVETAAQQWVQQQANRAVEVRKQLARTTTPPEQRMELAAELEQVRTLAAARPPTTRATALLEDWDVLDGPARQRRLTTLVRRIDVENIRPTPLLDIWTTWGTVMAWSGVQAERTGPSRPRLPEALPAAAPTAPATDPLQLLTPAEAARVAGVKVHTVRSWDVAGHLPHTQMAPDGATRRYAIQDLRKMRSRYKTNGLWVAL